MKESKFLTAKNILFALTLAAVLAISTALLRAQASQETNDQVTGQTEGFVATSVFAADLPCVQRAINWNNGGNATTINYVRFSTVALHNNGIAAYATGTLRNLECSAKPWGLGRATCLNSDSSVALLSDRVGKNEGYDQPFNVRKPLSLQVVSIPTDSLGEIVMRQPNAIYKFHPACVGDLLTGNDQWGNHWTMSFQFSSGPNLR